MGNIQVILLKLGQVDQEMMSFKEKVYRRTTDGDWSQYLSYNYRKVSKRASIKIQT